MLAAFDGQPPAGPFDFLKQDREGGWVGKFSPTAATPPTTRGYGSKVSSSLRQTGAAFVAPDFRRLGARATVRCDRSFPVVLGAPGQPAALWCGALTFAMLGVCGEAPRSRPAASSVGKER